MKESKNCIPNSKKNVESSLLKTVSLILIESLSKYELIFIVD